MTTKTSKHVVNVVPLPAPRPRVTKFGTYMPASYTKYRKEIAAALPATTDPKLEGALAITLEFVCKPIGKSKYTTPMGDLDNLAKGVLDTLQDLDWYGDDRQFTQSVITKRFPEPGEQPHIRFHITALE